MTIQRDWHRWNVNGGGDPMEEYHDDMGFTISTSPHLSDHVTVLRTRLQLWAWWANNDVMWPGPNQTLYPLKAKIQYNFAETGSFPAPSGWPADPGVDEVSRHQPTVYGALTLGPMFYRPPDPVAVVPQLYYGSAYMDQLSGDSAGQRRFDDTYVITAWLAISQGNTDWGNPPSFIEPILFNFAATYSVLIEYDA